MEIGKIWHIAELDGLELNTAAYIQQVFPWHFHDTYCICVLEQGIETLDFRHQTVRVPAGSILVVNALEVHSNYSGGSQGWRYHNIYASTDHLAYAASLMGHQIGPALYFPNKVIQDDSLYTQILRIHFRLVTEGFTPANEQLLFNALGELVRKYAVPGSLQEEDFKKRFSEVLAFMDHHAVNKISLDHLARMAGLSRFHFIREFQRATGLPPIAYLTQKRIELAKGMLRQEVSLVEVALETGFFDQSHFARNFKKLVGTTPGRYILYNHRNIVQ